MLIRNAHITDAQEIARLSSQLGYEASVTEVSKRLEKLLGNDDNAVYIMEDNISIITGWVHVHGRHLIEVDSYAEIGGLVVDVNHRRKGIGEQLMRQCEDWARMKGYKEVRLRSGSQRKAAHEFYRTIGYENIKWQEVFSLKLN